MKIKFDTPCEADWKSMTGDNKRRFCSLCKKSVHNLSGLTETEAQTFLRDKDKLCVRYEPTSDGRVRFQTAQIRTWFFVAAAMSASACDTDRSPLVPESTPVETLGGHQETVEFWVPPAAECDIVPEVSTQEKVAPKPVQKADAPRPKPIVESVGVIGNRFQSRSDLGTTGGNHLITGSNRPSFAGGMTVTVDLFEAKKPAPQPIPEEQPKARRKKKTKAQKGK